MQYWFLLIVVPLLLTEFTEICPWLARKILRVAAWMLRDPDAVARFTDEWEGELEVIPGKLVKVGYALLRLLLLPLTFIEVRIDMRSAQRMNADSIEPQSWRFELSEGVMKKLGPKAHIILDDVDVTEDGQYLLKDGRRLNPKDPLWPNTITDDMPGIQIVYEPVDEGEG